MNSTDVGVLKKTRVSPEVPLTIGFSVWCLKHRRKSAMAVKKGKEAEQLLEGRAAMIRRAKDTADGFDMQPFSFAKTASAVEAELESSPEKECCPGLGRQFGSPT